MTLSIAEVENCKDLADSYLDIQKTRVAMGLRIYQLENKHLMKVDLCERITVNEPKKKDEQVEDDVIDEETGEIKEADKPSDLITEKDIEQENEELEGPIAVKRKKVGYKYVRANDPVEKEVKPLRRYLRKYNALKEKEASQEQLNEWYEDIPEQYKADNIDQCVQFIEMTVKGLEAKLKVIREKIKIALDDLANTSETFKRFLERFKDLEKIENNIIKDAEAVFGETKIWKYFKTVKGLGPVACLTMLGNVDVIRSPTIGHAWSNLGLIPGKTLKRGEVSNFNPKVRARILGVICNNIIKLGDPYYTGIYAIKKAYHQNRPDLLAKKEVEKSWLMHMHRMSYRIMAKILVSHAYYMIRDDLGSKGEEIVHRNHLPLKPLTNVDLERVLLSYQKNHDRMLANLKPLWEKYQETQSEEAKAAYYEELAHPTIEFGIAK